MTREVIGSVFLGVWLGCFAAAAGQLPPEIQVDRYLLRADRLIEAKDPKGALELMGKIIALQKEHGLTFPEEFHFKYATVALSAGSIREAMDAVNTYLLEAGREGKFYREALELLEEVEEVQSWFDAEHTCAGKSEGAECWMEVTGQPGCYVWNLNLQPDETVTWSGGCSGGRAQGEGRLKWVWGDGEKNAESTGSLTDGTMHGRWVARLADGEVQEGPYAEGKRHGQWVLREADGDVREGPYEEGRRHGQWAWRLANGNVWEGPYVEGKLQGHWVGRYKDGSVQAGAAVDGNRHGQWVERDADGQVHEGPYVEGEKEGQWVERRSDGSVAKEGPYKEGQKHGHWVSRFDDGKVYEEGPYAEGKKHGHWVIRRWDGSVHEGPYVEGEKEGQWVERRSDGSVAEQGPYREGKKHGHWVERCFHDRIGRISEGPYLNDERHGQWVIYLERDKKRRVRGGGAFVDGKKHGNWVDYDGNGKKAKMYYENGTWTNRYGVDYKDDWNFPCMP